ncbi:MAG: 6-phosphogluconolactonase, partial [Actinomycetota bacterium]|nr:6-phosphogluconolactonase [Actinomycetota bacterium]
MRILVHENKADLAEAAARDFVKKARKAIEENGSFAVALAGGSTPEATYKILASEYSESTDLDWSRGHVFFGDERTVPPDH